MNTVLSRALISAILVVASYANSADIVALCIGNDAYAKVEDRLDTPVADAKLMKSTLEALPGGADVVLLSDAKRADIVIALNALKARSKGAKLALVFYSGHGMDGRPTGYAGEDTFLLPVDAEIPSEDHLAVSAVGLQEVLGVLKDCPVTARAVILDCCRTGAPKAAGALIAGGTKNFGQLDERVRAALGKAVVPDATLVAFAASPLRKAASFLSSEDKNSPFTAFIAAELRDGTGNLRDLIETAALKTEAATERRQVPYVSYNGATSAIRQIVWREAVAQRPDPALVANAEEVARLRAALENAEAERVASQADMLAIERLRKELDEARQKLAATETVKDPASTRSDAPATQVQAAPMIATSAIAIPQTDLGGAFPAKAEVKFDFENSLGMKFIRVPKLKVMFCLHETRVADFRAFVSSTKFKQGNPKDESELRMKWEPEQGARWDEPGFIQGEDHPVTSLDWEHVRSFCAWISKKEGKVYRLPTDKEWSVAVGLGDLASSPEYLSEGNVFPWGSEVFPPPSKAGNYSDKRLIEALDFTSNSGRDDGFAFTSPVMSFPANSLGLFDMGGNVWEWTSDLVDGASRKGSLRMVRGASWMNSDTGYCRSMTHCLVQPDRGWMVMCSRSMIGFRVVIEDSK